MNTLIYTGAVPRFTGFFICVRISVLSSDSSFVNFVVSLILMQGIDMGLVFAGCSKFIDANKQDQIFVICYRKKILLL